MKKQQWVTFILRLIVGGVVLVAGLLKANNPSKSAMAVRAYEILPVNVANIWGYILPWLEIGSGLLILLGIAIRANAIFTALLFTLFILAVSSAWARGLNIDCGCFGGGGEVAPGKSKYLQEILRDLGLFLGSLFLYKYPYGKFSIDKNSVPQEEPI